MSIAQLRTGAALAEANLLFLQPTTWSALRRIKTTYGQFIVTPDPTAAEANQLWGVQVLRTTQITAGAGLLLDTNKFGFVVVREAISLRTGTNDDDFTRNLVRWISEERLELAIERPAAVLSISGFPTSCKSQWRKVFRLCTKVPDMRTVKPRRYQTNWPASGFGQVGQSRQRSQSLKQLLLLAVAPADESLWWSVILLTGHRGAINATGRRSGAALPLSDSVM